MLRPRAGASRFGTFTDDDDDRFDESAVSECFGSNKPMSNHRMSEGNCLKFVYTKGTWLKAKLMVRVEALSRVEIRNMRR